MYEGGCGEKEAGVCKVSSSPMDSSRNLEPARENGFAFVKKVLKENGNFDLALRKRLFCNAKPTLLPCKTYAFGTQNNRFCNALIARWLYDSYACEKYLQYLWAFRTAMADIRSCRCEALSLQQSRLMAGFGNRFCRVWNMEEYHDFSSFLLFN